MRHYPLVSHLDVLRRRHETMDRAVRQAQGRPAAPEAEIATLKRRKLLIKDAIVGIEHRLSS
jgi:hypothetical protein